MSSKQTNKFDNAHNLPCILCNVPILPAEELHGPHKHIYEFLRSELPLPRLEDEHKPSSLPLSLYIHMYERVFIYYIPYRLYAPSFPFFVQELKVHTSFFKFLYVRVWHQPTLVSTSNSKPFVPAHKPQRSMEWPTLKWKQITLWREIIFWKANNRYGYSQDILRSWLLSSQNPLMDPTKSQIYFTF